jgi:anti-sigma regulatory factor (Ser/Thr protein kinase)
MSQATAQDDQLKTKRTGHRVELNLLSHPGLLRKARIALEEYGREMGLNGTQSDRIGLALNEALANVMCHGYGGATDKPINVTFDRRGQGAGLELVVTIRDWAPPFDPATLPWNPPPPDPETIKPGGLGLLCMKKLMDEVVFTPQPDGMLLTMVKKVTTQETQERCCEQ